MTRALTFVWEPWFACQNRKLSRRFARAAALKALHSTRPVCGTLAGWLKTTINGPGVRHRRCVQQTLNKSKVNMKRDLENSITSYNDSVLAVHQASLGAVSVFVQWGSYVGRLVSIFFGGVFDFECTPRVEA